MSKRLIAIIISIALLVALAGCGSSQPAGPDRVDTPAGTFDVYRNSQYSLSIQFPANWTKQEDSPGALVNFYAPLQDAADPFSENANVIVQELGQRMTLDDYSQATLEPLQKLGTVDIRLSDVTLAGLPARKAFYTLDLNGVSMDFRQFWTVKGTRAYIITFTSQTSRYSDYEAVFDQMAGSFKLGG